MSFLTKIASLAVKRVDDADCDECPTLLPGRTRRFRRR
jgi:hypothetical protein